MLHTVLKCALGVLATLLLATAAPGTTVNISPTQDATLYEDANGQLAGGALDAFFVGRNGFAGGQKKRRGLVKFDIAANIPAGATITSVTLKLYLNKASGDGSEQQLIRLFRVTNDWGEGGSFPPAGGGGSGTFPTLNSATWYHTFYVTQFWTNPGGDFDPNSRASQIVGVPNSSYTWNSTALMISDVQSWLDNPTTNYGWALIGNEVSGMAKRFSSRENLTASQRPELTVIYDETPPAPVQDCDGWGVLTSDYNQDCYVDMMDFPILDPNLYPQFASEWLSCTDPNGIHCINLNAPPSGPELTPFLDALPILTVKQPTTGSVGGVAHYDISMVEFQQQLHQQLPLTTLWGYDGQFPGPTIEATANQQVTVDWTNDLRDPNNNLRTSHYLAVDTCPHGPDLAGDSPRTVVHLHGIHAAEQFDGYPEDTFLPGQTSITHEYPNIQLPATLWYHDHALGITRLNVYMGLAGFYLIRDATENSLGLPSGEFEIPLMICDRTFNADGSLQYPAAWQQTYFGNRILVNGKVWPYLNVKQGKYRFRIVNASGSRFYRLSLSNSQNMTVIGSDGGLLPSPVTLSQVTIAPAERVDLIIDFSSHAAGTEIILTNDAPAPFPGTTGVGVIPNVMKFIVQGQTGHTAAIPDPLRTFNVIPEGQAIQNRTLTLQQHPDACTGNTWLINGLMWDNITEFPVLGTTEIWTFSNRSGMTHPMHMHLVMFQVLDRQAIMPDGTTVGSPLPPEPEFAGWKDTVQVHPFEQVRVIATFTDFTGKFAYHCHILEHEDHEMMRQFQVVAPSP